MDNRLFTIGTARPGKIRKQDIPAIATAIVGWTKGFGVVDANSIRNVPYVRLHGETFDVLVTGTEWLKILPRLQDGTLTTTLFPSPRIGLVDPATTRSGSDFGDPLFYSRVLATLLDLFKDAEAYPVQTVVQGFTPSAVPGLFTRLDAARPNSFSLVGSSVSVWRETVHGHSAHQLTPVARPTYVSSALNGLPGVEFDGTQWLDLPLTALDNWSAFIVGKYQLSVQDVGGFVVAAGFEGLGSGLDCYVKQNTSIVTLPGPSGRLATWLFGDFAPISPDNDAVDPDTFKLLYWSQQSQTRGGSRARVGLHGDVNFCLSLTPPYDLSQEGWDPNRQRAGNPPPLLGAIGRYSGLLAGGPTFYLTGTICEILLYSRVLDTSEHSQVAAFLNAKWGGTLL
jgi:hypothetical protein